MTTGDRTKALQQEREAERRRLVERLSTARTARERLDLLISSPHAVALVPTMPAEDLYFTIKDVGLSDSLELVHLASPMQFRSFVDLDAWKRDGFNPATALFWLRAARTDDDDQRYRRKLAGLDMEVVELLLKSTLKIHDLQEDEDPHLEGNFYRSPENRYIVEFTVEGTEYIGIKGLLDDMYSEDPFKAARLLEAVRWELPSELEETAFRWRTARLSDLGFPELSEAMSYFGYVDPDAALPKLEAVPHVPQGFFLARLPQGGSFFEKSAAGLSGDERAILEKQLVTVMNAVLVVEGVDPSELPAVTRALASARDTLSLGLEYAAGRDLQKGTQLLAAVPTKRLFQIGVSLALKLKFRADRLMKTGKASLPGTKGTPLLDPPVGEAITALRQRRPQFVEALVDHNAPISRTRPFRELAELAATAEALETAEKLVEVFEALEFNPQRAEEAVVAQRGPELLEEIRFSDLFLTAVAREAVGEGVSFAPLLEKRLPEVLERAFDVVNGEAKVKPFFEKTLRELVEDEAEMLSEAHKRAARLFADYCLSRLVQELGRPYAASGKVDPAYATALLISRR